MTTTWTSKKGNQVTVEVRPAMLGAALWLTLGDAPPCQAFWSLGGDKLQWRDGKREPWISVPPEAATAILDESERVTVAARAEFNRPKAATTPSRGCAPSVKYHLTASGNRMPGYENLDDMSW